MENPILTLRELRETVRRKILSSLREDYNEFWKNEEDLYVFCAAKERIATLNPNRNLSLVTLITFIGSKRQDLLDGVAGNHPDVVCKAFENWITECKSKRQEYFDKCPGLEELFNEFNKIREQEATQSTNVNSLSGIPPVNKY